jgi:hypothetical protein
MMGKKTEKNQIENYFEWWLIEMQSNGYIKEWTREPETWLVKSTAIYSRYKRFKTKEKQIEDFNLFPRIEYTFDYVIIWDKSAEYIFYEEVLESPIFQFGKPSFIAHDIEGVITSYVDVKPTNSVQQRGGKVSSAVTFPLKQRMIWDNVKLYINKVVPMPMAGTGYHSALFIKTFTPKRYMLTDGGKIKRKIKFEIVTLADFVNKKALWINNLLKNTK